MPQFFIKTKNISGGQCIIEGDDFKHLKTVRRVKPGDHIDLRSEDGSLYKGKISIIDTSSITVDIEIKTGKHKTSLNLILYCAVLKGKSFDLVLQKATEIGISGIMPVLTERTIPQINIKKERWEKILLNASKQCMRNDIPFLNDVLKYHEAVRIFSQKKIIAHPNESHTESNYLTDLKNLSDISVLIGPEGGFSEKELKLANENRWERFTFSHTSLRAETACIVIPSIIMHEWERQNQESLHGR